jgi:DNA-binding CsgD family transcriptional regulator
MLDRSRTRAEDLQRKGLRPIDAHIVASVEAGDSAEQVARRLGITREAVHAALRRGRDVF